ncbi:unnamed protein product [Clavelina lepadiformis]|uniref:Uncharacterized protein n=1 Tax=Clavelina lepadiformis TaxID=159417 RepID=A0ABP0GI88_CLALP
MQDLEKGFDPRLMKRNHVWVKVGKPQENWEEIALALSTPEICRTPIRPIVISSPSTSPSDSLHLPTSSLTKASNCFCSFDESVDENETENAVDVLGKTWLSVSPPIEEQDVLNQWYRVIDEGKKKKTSLYIGKVTRRFLEDENGPVHGLEIDCLKPHVGQGNVLKSVPDHMPSDIDFFPVCNIISGPLRVEPLEGSKWHVSKFAAVKRVFNDAKSINKRELATKLLM